MKKTFIVVSLILLILAAIYFYVSPGKNLLEIVGLKKPAPVDPVIAPAPATPEDLTKKTPTDGSFVNQAPIVKDSNGFPLQQGDGSIFKPNQSVKEVQQALNDLHGSTLKVDGIFGPKTARALSAHGFPVVIYLEDYYQIQGV